MANARERHASIFLNTRKIAEAFKFDTELNSGDELQYGDEGVIAVSDGAANSAVNFDMIVPVSGASVSPEQLMLDKEYVDVQQGLLNGKIWECSMRFTKVKYDSEMKAGTLVCSASLIGGRPTIT